MEFTVKQIANMLGGEVRGDEQAVINMLARIQEAKAGQIAFLANPKYEQFIYLTAATAVIVRRDFQPKRDVSSTLIMVDDPYNSFTTLLEEYHKLLNFQKVGIEQPSYLGEKVQQERMSTGEPSPILGNGAKLGDNVKVYPHVFVGDNVTIGDNTILYANVKLYAGTRIGNNCAIHSGTVIGSDGFGFAPQGDGTYKTIPQLGNVIIEDNVTIGANSVIDCATCLATQPLFAEV